MTGVTPQRKESAPALGSDEASLYSGTERMRVTIKAVNEGLSRRGFKATLEQASGYFFFDGAETESWLNRAVSVERVSS
jgi:hypothetical protein